MAAPFPSADWPLEQLVAYLLEKGLDALWGAIKTWAQQRETQAQLKKAIGDAEAQTRQRYPHLAELFSLEILAQEVLRVALNPPLLIEPPYQEIMRSACRPTADREQAREALHLFFAAFREEWEQQPAFASLRGQYEDIRIRQSIERMLSEGIPVYPAPVAPPDAELLCAYLQAAAAQKPPALWDETPYIKRTVAAQELFPRTVIPYRQDTPQREAPAEPLEKALERAQKLVLLGAPGMGKTTCLQHLAQKTAQEALTGAQPSYIPIYLELKTYRGQELEASLAQRMDELLRPSGHTLPADGGARLLHDWLRHQDLHFLLLLDGLNEVPAEFHTTVRSQLNALFQYPQRIIVSCRERDYDECLRNCAIAFVLRGLQEEEIESYLQALLGREKGTELFWQEIRWEEKMRSLASNPLMLFLIGMVVRADPQARLPANRGQLFQRFVTWMPRLRQSEGQPIQVPLDVVESALARLGDAEMREMAVRFGPGAPVGFAHRRVSARRGTDAGQGLALSAQRWTTWRGGRVPSPPLPGIFCRPAPGAATGGDTGFCFRAGRASV